MIIYKLQMYNFRQFIGHQEIEFSTDKENNTTVLIGVNTSGKTTIIRAFEWCLYGKNGFEDQVLLNNEVRKNMNVGETQIVWVAITFTHDDKLYTIRRQYKYICNERKTENEKVVVLFNKKPEEDLTLEYLQNDGQTKTPIDLSNITDSIDRVLPKDLSEYFFFGGERISNIANRVDLSKAVRGLMGLDVLENASTHLSKVIKSFESNIDTSGDANAQMAKDSLETFKKKKQQLLDEKDNFDKQMQYWKSKEMEFNVKLGESNIEQVKQAKKEIERLESALLSEEKKLANAKVEIVKAFNNRPYSFFGMPVIRKSLELLDALEGTANNVLAVPDMEQGAIDHLIKRGYCICGTELQPGSLSVQRIMEERRLLPPEQVGSAAHEYKNKAEGYLAGTENYKETIENKYKEIRTLKRQLGQLNDDLAKMSDLIIDDTEAKEIMTKLKDAHIKYLEAKSDYEQCVANIGGCDTNIKNCSEALAKYANSSAKNERVAKFISYSRKVYELLLETYKDKEKKVRRELQKRVNENFRKMYHGERTIQIDDKYRVNYLDVTTDESDGLKAVKSFAFVASLVSMAKDKILDDPNLKLGREYPLVMDAPFSNVDEIHINNICNILPHTANQIIMAVMEKDWEYASKNLNQYVGKRYRIEKDKDEKGKAIETMTHIKKEGSYV